MMYTIYTTIKNIIQGFLYVVTRLDSLLQFFFFVIFFFLCNKACVSFLDGLFFFFLQLFRDLGNYA